MRFNSDNSQFVIVDSFERKNLYGFSVVPVLLLSIFQSAYLQNQQSLLSFAWLFQSHFCASYRHNGYCVLWSDIVLQNLHPAMPDHRLHRYEVLHNKLSGLEVLPVDCSFDMVFLINYFFSDDTVKNILFLITWYSLIQLQLSHRPLLAGLY